MSRHRGEATQSPWLLLAAFAVIAALLFTVFRLANPAADVTHVADGAATASSASSRTTATASDTVTSATPRATPRIQAGVVVEPVPTPVCREVEVDTSVTVLSYNIKSARTNSLAAFAGVIRESGADVVLLQEVDMLRRGTGRVNQPAALAAQLGGWGWAFGRNVGYGATAGYGTAILSRHPIVAQENRHLPNGPGGQQRGLLKAVVDVDGVHVSFYSTHLQNRIDYLKVRQAQTIAAAVAADPNPKVLGGDMNSHEGSTPIRALEGPLDDTWLAAGQGDGRTHPSTRLRGRIDYLFHGGPSIAPTVATVMASTASDHRAVRAAYALSGVTERRCELPD
jgi:endonuclease/exonuclease/phosphatase family metal-dependent hydrolase